MHGYAYHDPIKTEPESQGYEKQKDEKGSKYPRSQKGLLLSVRKCFKPSDTNSQFPLSFSMDQVKRLYDTFHEPFKRVIPSCSAVPENPVHNNAEPSSVNEVVEVDNDMEDASKRRKKEPESTVKSALSAAFAQYSEKIGKRNNRAQGKKDEEKGHAPETEAENKPSDEGAAS